MPMSGGRTGLLHLGNLPVTVKGDNHAGELVLPVSPLALFQIGRGVIGGQTQGIEDALPRHAFERLTIHDALLVNFSEESFAAVEAREDRVDQYEDKIGSYLVRLNAMELSRSQSAEVSRILHTLSDFERISDHAMNLAETAREIHEKKIHFSEKGQRELDVLLQAIYEILRLSFNAFSSNDTSLAYRVEPLEEHIDEMCDEMKLHHVERLQTGECSINLGFVYNDLLTNLERVADHCSNVAIAVIETEENVYDAHDYVIRLREERTHHFDSYYNEYCEKYKI